ncbi:HTH-type transcriptional activator RhaR [Paenibacillus sp. JJ-100]|uniref:helix-turn-helix transcriptional regulator n=1 Tax=Paenibacillus sp. JJ-100 TaxID=2974896 RepID=UPI0022FF802F|nr:AraC family transcriptional regulator [Paenibacillus sp. JJ-100]CAI6081757.1 HTH-type transcriptional activator RhaR [Paenibacillus sp. JJ-100]
MLDLKALHENTRMDHQSHPFQLFQNRCFAKKTEECILYLHWHEHFEWVIMRKGRAVFHIDSRPYEAEAGEVIIIPGGALHVGYSLEEGDVHYDSVVVNRALFQDFASDPVHEQYVAPYLEGSVRFPVKPAVENVDCISYFSLLNEAVEEMALQAPAYQLVVKSKLHALFTLLARTFTPHPLRDRSSGVYFPNRERFKQLIAQIEGNPQERLSVSEAASQVGLNVYHFCKMFKKLTGRTFVEYVNRCRMSEAERLLQDSGLTVTEIAAQVGCDNANYFTKLFKQYKGMTPSQARAGVSTGTPI